MRAGNPAHKKGIEVKRSPYVHEAIRVKRGNDMAGGESTDHEKASIGPAPGPRGMPRQRLKTVILGVGVALIIIGVALAAYVATEEDEPVLMALAPAFIGVIIVIAALFGKKL